MREITSITNPLVKEWMRLHQKKERDEKNQFLVEGYHLVEEAKKANLLQEVLILDKKQVIPGVSNTLVNQAILTKLTKTKEPQMIVGLCNMPSPKSLTGNRFLLLDNIQDPGNMGTLFRSALGFLVDKIVLSPNCVDLFNDKVIRATQGAIFHQNWIKMDLQEAIAFLQKKAVNVYGTALKKATPLSQVKKQPNYAIILGNEGNGIHPDYLNKCDEIIQIETSNSLESLNVGVAGSIILYEFFKEIGA